MKEEKVRQLAAVMFTDIVGYTALMQEDEEIALKVRTRHREVFQQQHELHQGEIVQYYGDGTLSVFKSAIEAVKCAIEIQRLLQNGDPVPLRIGLHLGDIVFDKTEVYGDGVNYAARIESLGVKGAILLSGKLNDELKNHASISTTSLGEFALKNIDSPVEVFAVTNKGISVPKSQDLKGKRKSSNKTIAVLPFVNMSASQENEYFSDGITEEIINALAKIKSLKVTSRTSSFHFKNTKSPIKEIGERLLVSTILEGSVRVSGNMLRITAQLIQAEEDFHFWSETWDRKLENIFEIQDEISLNIADKLREQFGHFEIQEHLVSKQTENIDAYGYFLKAKFHFNKWNPEDTKAAISLFEQALTLDANHTESLLGLADAYSFLAMTGFMSFEEGWGKSAQFANKALSLNDNIPGGHYHLANLAFFTASDFKESFEQCSKAIELKPNFVEAQQFMSFLYILAGEKEKSRQHLELALAIDPLSQETQFFNAYFHYMVEDYQKALHLLDASLEANDKNIPAHSVKCLCLLLLSRLDEAIGYFDEMPAEIIIPADKIGVTGLAYALKNDKKNANKYLNELGKLAATPDGFAANSFLFMMYAVMGEIDKAFEWINESIENKSSLLLLRFADPMVNSLKSDLRYAQFQKSLFAVSVEEIKKKKELLNASAVTELTERLLDYIPAKSPYLDPNLTLRSLADQIDMHPNQLSWLLNESLGKNFSEFINHYRVEAFKKKAKKPENGHITLIGLAFDSGFNSKTVFNTYFKKETGLTPKQFLKQ